MSIFPGETGLGGCFWKDYSDNIKLQYIGLNIETSAFIIQKASVVIVIFLFLMQKPLQSYTGHLNINEDFLTKKT